MKQNILFIAVIFILVSVFGLEASAHSATEHNDSIAAALKLNGLQKKRDKLLDEIKVQDAKRNKQIAGVAPETIEAMNDRQDSICLALRSELVDVILEIKESSPEVVSPAFLQQYNNLVNRKDQDSRNQDPVTESKKHEK